MSEPLLLNCSDIEPEDLKVTPLYEVVGLRRNQRCLVVKIEPTIETVWLGDAIRVDELILVPISPNDIQDLSLIGIQNQGREEVMVDIVVCPEFTGTVIDELRCSRIGVGGLKPISGDAAQDELTK